METSLTRFPASRTLAVIAGGKNLGVGASPPADQKPKFLDQVRQAIRTRHYSPKTEDSYVHPGFRSRKVPLAARGKPCATKTMLFYL